MPLVGPPAHPFRSLDALRLLTVVQNDPIALPLARQLAWAAWAEGEKLAAASTLRAAADHVGFAGNTAEIIADPAIKLALRTNTDTALAAGVFGGPTFEFEAELFWGHDRMSHLAARIAGDLASPSNAATTMAAKPRGADRTQRPTPKSA